MPCHDMPCTLHSKVANGGRDDELILCQPTAHQRTSAMHTGLGIRCRPSSSGESLRNSLPLAGFLFLHVDRILHFQYTRRPNAPDAVGSINHGLGNLIYSHDDLGMIYTFSAYADAFISSTNISTSTHHELHGIMLRGMIAAATSSWAKQPPCTT
jgi:hypothetical protein